MKRTFLAFFVLGTIFFFAILSNRSFLPYQEEGGYFDPVDSVVYYEQAMALYGSLALLFLVLSLVWILIAFPKNKIRLFAVLALAAILCAIYFSAKSASTVLYPDRVVKEFYDKGARYESNPELLAKVMSAGSKTGGIEYDPIWCAQDEPVSAIYTTMSKSDDSAVVEAQHIYNETQHDSVRISVLLERRDRGWHIVDVTCLDRGN